jgi:4-amino-4-deoxy-L-arabinose transferase-like glycosyltransferase
MAQKSKFPKILWNLIVLAFLAGGILALVFFSLPFESARGLANYLVGENHLRSLTEARFASLRLLMQAAGLVLLAAGAVFTALRKHSQAWVADGLGFLARIMGDVRQDWRTMVTADWRFKRLEKADLFILLGLALAAAGIRAAFVARPMSHDEAYTIVAFATRPLWVVLSDYSLPNNHVFHSLLVHFSYLLFGLQPWAVRLPVVAAGVLVVPAGYLLARLLYGRPTALLTAALLAGTPLMVNLATDARGYILICLFSLLIFSLGVYVQQHQNKAAWGLIVLFSALGFYTTPIMIYPFGVLITWLMLAALAGETRPAYGTLRLFFKYLAVSATASGLLAAFLYTPIFFTYGLKAVVANRFVLPLSPGDFLSILPGKIAETWNDWTGSPDGMPVLGFIFLAGTILSLLLNRRISSCRAPLQAAAVLWLAVELPIQRPYPWPKLWSWLLPLFLMWGSAGLLGLFKEIKLGGKYGLAMLLSGAAILAVLGASLGGAIRNFPAMNANGEIETTALYLKSQLRQGDIVVVSDPDDAPLWYYFKLHQIPDSFVINIQHVPFQRAFVLVNPDYGQSLASVIDQRGPDIKRLIPASAQVVNQSGSTFTYLVLARVGK